MELLVTMSMRFATLNREVLAAHLEPVIRTAVEAGGVTTNVSVQEYNPDEESAE
jgi:hypothetical protein